MVAYQALVLEQTDTTVSATYQTKLTPDLAKDGVLVKVAYSDINYKDRLAMNPKSGVLRHYPMTPGVDFAGEVVESDNPFFEAGDQVLCTGYETGITIAGGYAEYVKVPSEWLFKLPENLSLAETMQFGTAGFTAAIALSKLLRQAFTADHDTPLLITGATGGVGSFALTILAQLGFTNLTATTRDLQQTDYLLHLGATHVINAADLTAGPLKALSHQTFTGVIDTLGGPVLAHILPQVCAGGFVATCGNAAGATLETTVMPFILRGITLAGIDSVYYPRKDRKELWQLLATTFKPEIWPTVNLVAFSDLARELSQKTHKTGRVLVAF